MEGIDVKQFIVLALCMVLLATTGCYTMIHEVGEGAAGTTTVKERQWYFLGLALNDVDSHTMADGAENYTIKTEYTILDILISIPSTCVGITPWTVEVTKNAARNPVKLTGAPFIK